MGSSAIRRYARTLLYPAALALGAVIAGLGSGAAEAATFKGWGEALEPRAGESCVCSEIATGSSGACLAQDEDGSCSAREHSRKRCLKWACAPSAPEKKSPADCAAPSLEMSASFAEFPEGFSGCTAWDVSREIVYEKGGCSNPSIRTVTRCYAFRRGAAVSIAEKLKKAEKRGRAGCVEWRAETVCSESGGKMRCVEKSERCAAWAFTRSD
jgi:hypothetical protein